MGDVVEFVEKYQDTLTVGTVKMIAHDLGLSFEEIVERI